MAKELFNITGMTCAGCSARVEKTVAGLEGVQQAAVNLLTNSMEVRFDEGVLTAQDIIKAVEKTGYGASVKGKESASPKAGKTAAEAEVKNAKIRLVWSVIFLAPLFYISMGHMAGLPIPSFLHGTENALSFAFTQFLLTVPIVFINFHYFKNGFKNLFRLSPNMDSLIAIGASAAVVYGIVAIYRISWGMGHDDMHLVHQYSMDLYFESAGTILTLITLGKLLESKAKRKTTDAITGLINLRPQTAVVIRDGKQTEVPIDQVAAGDIVAVKQGGAVPVDGVIVNGSCTVDESIITGESMPVEKQTGDSVIGAAINLSGYAEVRATKVGQDSTLNQIIKLVEEASATKAPVARLADKISGVFVPVVIAIAVVAAVVWLLLGYGTEFALSTGIAVLVISCPCALGLATPTAIMTGTGRGAQMGILIKSAEALETAGHIDTVVLDKTGTITEGKPRVTDIIPLSADKQELLSAALAVESLSEHPLARAVVEYAKKTDCKELKAEGFVSCGGKGVSAEVQGKTVYAGNIRLMQEKGIDVFEQRQTIDALAQQGKTPLFFAKNKSIMGIIAVADVVKETSAAAVKELKDMNIDVVMLTGDNKATAKAIGDSCGIDNVVAEVLPQDKEQQVRQLQQGGHRAAMVGDGINDAPALAKADVGVAIGAGTDIAIDSADVVLVKSSLLDIVKLIQLSRATMRNIKENLFWALIYNTIGIPLAAGVFFSLLGWRLNPMYGAAAMCFSSVCVVLNALRLRTFKPRLKYSAEKAACGRAVDGNPKCGLGGTEENLTHNNTEDTAMTKTVIIDGMRCSHCSGRVQQVLNSLPGVKAEVSLDKKCAVVTGSADNEEIKKAVENAGYKVVEIK